MSIAQRVRSVFGVGQSQRPPMLGGGLPYIGHAIPFSKDPIALLQEGKRKYGDAFTIQMLGNKLAVLLGADANEAVFRAPDDVLNPKEAYKLMTPIFGKGIAYDAEDHVMQEQLSFLHPALHKKRLQTYSRWMHEETERYVEKWGETGEVDLLDMMNELTMYVSSRCLLGEEIRKHLDINFMQLYQDLEAGLAPIAFFFPYLPIPRFKRRDKARVQIVALIESIVAERRKQGIEREDMLQTLMEARYKSDGRPLTADEITGLLLTIIFAGHHTSGTLATWAGIELLRHPQWIPDILKEQTEVYSKHEEVSFESLKDLKHLEYAIMEAERLHPPIVLMMRKAIKDFHFGGYTVPAGDMILVSPAVSNSDERVFTRPESYDPGRFAPPREENKKHSYSLTSFGGGKHLCIGLHFAYMQIKAIWSVLFRRFDLELSSPSYEPSYDFLVVGPGHPCNLRYRRKAKPLAELPRPLREQS